MKKTKLLIVISLFSLFFLAGCLDIPNQPQSTQTVEQIRTEMNQKTLLDNQPIPQLTKSLERENLINRLNLLNDEHKVFYVYLINYGKVMAFFTAKGKISSVSSYLTTGQQIIPNEQCLAMTSGTSDRSGCFHAVEAPDLDGSYGTNGDGIFFFTTENAYVEWKGDYMVSDYPLKLSTPPELVKQLKS